MSKHEFPTSPEAAAAYLRGQDQGIVGGTLSTGGPGGLCLFTATCCGGDDAFLLELVDVLIPAEGRFPAPGPPYSGKTWMWRDR